MFCQRLNVVHPPIRNVNFGWRRASQWLTNENPAKSLEPYLQVPLFPENEIIYNPSQDIIDGAQKYFDGQLKEKLTQHKGVVDLSKLPVYQVPEVAFVGASNVGKSSLIKSLLANRKGLKVPISPKPGFTKSLKLYQIGKYFTLVDMPGYGVNMPEYYTESMETYLQTRQRLLQQFILIDGSMPLQDEDHIGFQMMETYSKPYAVSIVHNMTESEEIVLTKIDNTSGHNLLRNVLALQKVQDDLKCCFPQVFFTSTKTDDGIKFLRSFIAYVTGLIAY